MNLSQHIDHTLLKSTAKEADFSKLFEEAQKHHFFSVCIPPHVVKTAAKELKNTDVKICSVAGFPNGYNTIKSKQNEIDELFRLGCDEVDVVLNINHVKNKDWDAVTKELKSFSKLSKENTIKVIIESGILTKKEIIQVCKITNQYPVTFLKTSTGFAEKSASIEAVQTMREHLDASIYIKASGGIKNNKQAMDYIHAGATRLGCSASVVIVENKI
jgi:deoxyribose-phosphate aldolase